MVQPSNTSNVNGGANIEIQRKKMSPPPPSKAPLQSKPKPPPPPKSKTKKFRTMNDLSVTKKHEINNPFNINFNVE